MIQNKHLLFTEESLAREINRVKAYPDLSDELIADEIFNNQENDASISAAIIDVILERQRQISGEGFTPEGDDEYDREELAYAAISYICLAAECKDKDPDSYHKSSAPMIWPWSPEWWKPKDPRRDLIRGIALLIAEAERRDRQKAA